MGGLEFFLAVKAVAGVRVCPLITMDAFFKKLGMKVMIPEKTS
jgi:hypothetical protein